MWGADPIIMDAAETVALSEVTKATIIAVHMEALDHCFTSRAALREAASKQRIGAAKLLIPRDGETIELGLPG